MAETSPVKVRTAGALRSGTSLCAEKFRSEFNRTFAASFTHGPHIEVELANGACDADIVGLMDDAIAGAIATGLLGTRRVSVGSIQIGIAMRETAERPDLLSLDTFVASLKAADALIYTTAASGEYMQGVFEHLGLAAMVAPKAVRFASGNEVNQRLMAGTQRRELAFGVATEFLANPRVVYLGPLPKEIQNPSPYEFAALKGRADDQRVQQVLDFFDTAEARRIFASTGVD